MTVIDVDVAMVGNATGGGGIVTQPSRAVRTTCMWPRFDPPMPSTVTPPDRHAEHDRWSERLAFLGALVRRGTTIASATPSSRWMCRELCRFVDAARPQSILELGAGTGVVTRAIVDAMHPASRLCAVELLPEFERFLRQGTDRATIVMGCVVERAAAIEALGPFDLVISGLPTPSLPRAARDAVRSLMRSCGSGAVFSQLTEIPMLYRGLYASWFKDVDFRLVGLNVPPGGVYHCRRPRSR
jgi:phospholipid N-methyltransferase